MSAQDRQLRCILGRFKDLPEYAKTLAKEGATAGQVVKAIKEKVAIGLRQYKHLGGSDKVVARELLAARDDVRAMLRKYRAEHKKASQKDDKSGPFGQVSTENTVHIESLNGKISALEEVLRAINKRKKA